MEILHLLLHQHPNLGFSSTATSLFINLITSLSPCASHQCHHFQLNTHSNLLVCATTKIIMCAAIPADKECKNKTFEIRSSMKFSALNITCYMVFITWHQSVLKLIMSSNDHCKSTLLSNTEQLISAQQMFYQVLTLVLAVDCSELVHVSSSIVVNTYKVCEYTDTLNILDQ